MSKQLKAWRLFGEDLEAAALKDKLSALPLLGFANDANEVFNGIRVLAEILQAGDVPEVDDDGNEGPTLISGSQRDAILGLIRVTSNLMVTRAERAEELSRNLMERDTK